MICENLSSWQNPNTYYLIQRRIFCSQLHLNFNSLDDLHLNSLFMQTKRDYIIKDKFSDFCKPESIAKNAAILIIIDHKLKNKEIVAKPEMLQNKVTK